MPMPAEPTSRDVTRSRHGLPAVLRAALTTLAIAAGALLVGGCGGSSGHGVARVSSAKGDSSASDEGAAPSPESKASVEQRMLAFAECMRSDGVPSFPDPNAGGGFRIGPRTDPSSPSFKAAEAKCQKLMPGGLLGPGSTTQPSALTMARMLKVAQCMREHSISAFPDPTTSVPSIHPGVGVVADREGAIFVLPSMLDMQSSQFMQAAAACGFALHNH
jgi:hypothetical protein